MSKLYDIVIIGGGIHGAGIAQAAAAAGHQVLLLEQQALAAGTSSRSSKLIHGGLRYLESAEFSLVRESLHERKLLLRLAPDLVHLTPFYIPIYSHTTRRPWQVRSGLSLYALLGGLHSSVRFRHVAPRQWSRLDGLSTDGLQAVYQYWDAQTNDAELTGAVMASAQSLGAELACPAEFQSAQYAANHFELDYTEGQIQRQCQCRVLVNATGPWVNQVQDRVKPQPSKLAIELVQGAHIFVPGELKWGIYYLEAPQDRRAVFVMPWEDHIMVGTTETVYHGDPSKVRALEHEIEYLQKTLKHYFPAYNGELLGNFAGLRVLPGGDNSVFRRSRETLFHRDPAVPRLMAIYGGKLTGYRATAAKAMHQLQPLLPSRNAIADTASLTLKPVIR